MINPQDIIIYDEIELTQNDLINCNLIVENTINTWQKDRSEDSKLQDTILGKIAEKSIKKFLYDESFIKSYLTGEIEGTETFAFYDDFRIDNFRGCTRLVLNFTPFPQCF